MEPETPRDNNNYFTHGRTQPLATPRFDEVYSVPHSELDNAIDNAIDSAMNVPVSTYGIVDGIPLESIRHPAESAPVGQGSLSEDHKNLLIETLIDGHDDRVYEYLCALEYSKAEAKKVVTELKKELSESMELKIKQYLRGKKVAGITDKVVDEYYAKEKKLRFLIKDERDGLHKPLSDGKKPTSSVKLDDLVPKD